MGAVKNRPYASCQNYFVAIEEPLNPETTQLGTLWSQAPAHEVLVGGEWEGYGRWLGSPKWSELAWAAASWGRELVALGPFGADFIRIVAC